MAQGKIVKVSNQKRKFGADPAYLFLKVQAEGRGEGGEEYWLVSEEEAQKFAYRAAQNPEDCQDLSLGVFTRSENTEGKAASNAWYVFVNVSRRGEGSPWMLTEFDLERVRERVEKNPEDIENNKEGWLADLFD